MEERLSVCSSMDWTMFTSASSITLTVIELMSSNFCHILRKRTRRDQPLRPFFTIPFLGGFSIWMGSQMGSKKAVGLPTA